MIGQTVTFTTALGFSQAKQIGAFLKDGSSRIEITYSIDGSFRTKWFERFF